MKKCRLGLLIIDVALMILSVPPGYEYIKVKYSLFNFVQPHSTHIWLCSMHVRLMLNICFKHVSNKVEQCRMHVEWGWTRSNKQKLTYTYPLQWFLVAFSLVRTTSNIFSSTKPRSSTNAVEITCSILQSTHFP